MPKTYWIIKTGIEHNARSGWGPTHQDEEISSVATFVRQLPAMSPADSKSAADKYPAAQKEEEE